MLDKEYQAGNDIQIDFSLAYFGNWGNNVRPMHISKLNLVFFLTLELPSFPDQTYKINNTNINIGINFIQYIIVK